MILPFIGVFISLTLWGTFYPVPGLTDPRQPFVKRIAGAMEATTMAKGIYDLTEAMTTVYLEAHPAHRVVAGHHTDSYIVPTNSTWNGPLDMDCLWKEPTNGNKKFDQHIPESSKFNLRCCAAFAAGGFLVSIYIIVSTIISFLFPDVFSERDLRTETLYVEMESLIGGSSVPNHSNDSEDSLDQEYYFLAEYLAMHGHDPTAVLALRKTPTALSLHRQVSNAIFRLVSQRMSQNLPTFGWALHVPDSDSLEKVTSTQDVQDVSGFVSPGKSVSRTVPGLCNMVPNKQDS